MKSCFSTLEERYRSVFPFRPEILMCLDKSETFKSEDEDYENESLKVFRRLLKNFSPVKLHYTIFIRKVIYGCCYWRGLNLLRAEVSRDILKFRVSEIAFQEVFSTADSTLFRQNTRKTGNNAVEMSQAFHNIARRERFTDLNLFK